jgi:hypothetical protein
MNLVQIKKNEQLVRVKIQRNVQQLPPTEPPTETPHTSHLTHLTHTYITQRVKNKKTNII